MLGKFEGFFSDETFFLFFGTESRKKRAFNIEVIKKELRNIIEVICEEKARKKLSPLTVNEKPIVKAFVFSLFFFCKNRTL